MRTDPDALVAYLCFALCVIGMVLIPVFCYFDGKRVEREHAAQELEGGKAS